MPKPRMKNVGKRRDGPEIDVHLTLRGEVASSLINAALARKQRPVDVLADAIEHLCLGNLFDAVIDDD